MENLAAGFDNSLTPFEYLSAALSLNTNTEMGL